MGEGLRRDLGITVGSFWEESARLPELTECVTVDEYLTECRERSGRGWSVNHAQTLEQMLAAYLAGLSEARPGRGEFGWELFVRPQPIPERLFNRLLVTLRDNATARKALRAVLNMEDQ